MAEVDEDVFRFLARPEAHDGAPVEVVETHTATVFLAGARAYKLKKPVRYSYLDYSTPALRKAFCEAEIAVNRKLAPALYIGVSAVTREADGRLAIDGRGEPLDWLVVMRRFDRDQQFDRMAERGALSPALTMALADHIAEAHRAAQIDTTLGGLAGLRQAIGITVENLRIAAQTTLSADKTEAWIARALTALDTQAPLLERRRREGHVRACHGDLHLSNICLFEGRPTQFDAIEFDPSLSTTDVLYDLAFLLMDLDHRRLAGLANLVFNRYLDRNDETDGLAALPLFLSTRAAIRAQVTVAALTHGHDATQAESLATLARAYLDQALDLLRLPQPRLIAVGGYSGSGKSSLAYALAPTLGPAPGARVLRTDILRKRAAGLEPESRLPASAYTPEPHRTTYRLLCEATRACLESGWPVIVDAVFGAPDERDAVEAVARDAGVSFAGLWLDAPADVLRARVSSRANDASDATPDVVLKQIDHGRPPDRWSTVDASGPTDAVARAAIAALRMT